MHIKQVLRIMYIDANDTSPKLRSADRGTLSAGNGVAVSGAGRRWDGVLPVGPSTGLLLCWGCCRPQHGVCSLQLVLPVLVLCHGLRERERWREGGGGRRGVFWGSGVC